MRKPGLSTVALIIIAAASGIVITTILLRGSFVNSSPTPSPAPSPAISSAPQIYSVSPSSGKVGSSVSVLGAGFTSTGNSLHFGQGQAYLNGISSSDGHTLQFILPDIFDNCTPDGETCWEALVRVQPGIYQVTVINPNGVSNAVSLTVIE